MKNKNNSDYYTTQLSRQESLDMWRGAKDYYTQNGWTNLALTADRQIRRIAKETAADFIQSGNPSIFTDQK